MLCRTSACGGVIQVKTASRTTRMLIKAACTRRENRSARRNGMGLFCHGRTAARGENALAVWGETNGELAGAIQTAEQLWSQLRRAIWGRRGAAVGRMAGCCPMRNTGAAACCPISFTCTMVRSFRGFFSVSLWHGDCLYNRCAVSFDTFHCFPCSAECTHRGSDRESPFANGDRCCSGTGFGCVAGAGRDLNTARVAAELCATGPNPEAHTGGGCCPGEDA